MNIVNLLQNIMMIGSEWILLLLLFLSVLALGIVFERFWYWRSLRPREENIREKIISACEHGETVKLAQEFEKCPSLESQLLQVLAKYGHENPQILDRHLSALISKFHHELDRNLPFLNTLGNNAPFIGLLGTVFGVISAFHHLAETNVGNSAIVMTGISEALVATGVGLCVAIPAVVFYNIFIRKVKRTISSLQELKEILIAINASKQRVPL